MAVSAGTASLQVVPQLAKQFSRDLMQQMVGPANRAADKTGHQAGQRLSRQFDRAGDDSARRYGVRFNKRLGAGFSASTKIASVAAGAIGGAFAAVQIGGFLKGAIEEAREAAKVGRQTAAVIKATGGVAKVSAGDVNRLADRLSALAGVDDEVIATGANMLLTFKNVRNEVGKGNNIFDQASVAALDMTAAMGKGVVTQEGLQASTIRLGKALNDPLKGMTALTKVGVTFTEGQRKQITALVEAGDTMGAQQIILKELATEFGGAAKAAADPWQRVTVAFGNVKESIGTALLPALNSVADFITATFIPAVQKWWKIHGPAVRDMFAAVAEKASDLWVLLRDELWPELLRGASYLEKNVLPKLRELKQSWDDNSEAISGLKGELKPLTDNVFPILAFLIKGTVDELKGAIGFLGLFARAWTAASRIANVAVTKLVVTVIEANRTIIRSAATLAEALHLPIAKGLRKAEQEMGAWVKDFNNNLNRLNDEGVNIKLRSTFTPPKGFSMHSIVGAQEGMRIPGYGGGDRIPIMAEAGEAVVPKHLAATSGFRDWAGGHGIPGFARGGVIPDLQPFSPAGARGTQAGIDRRVANQTAAGIGRNFKLLVAGAGIQRALSWARGEAGKPYVWGGVGPGGYDCSGFMSALANVVAGRSPHHRLFATGSFPTAGWAPGYSPVGFSIGSRRGNPGHMAGTLGGVNVESRGSMGVVVGANARGARSGLFGGNIWHLAGRSGSAGGEESLRIPRGRAFDRGGWLMPGTTIAQNNTGRPERVLPPGSGGGAITINVNVPPTAHPAEVGREVVHAIRQYEQRSGTSWRR